MSLTRLVLGCLVTSVVMTWAIILLKIWQIVQARLANQAFRLAQSGDSHRCVAQRSALARLMTQVGAVEPGLAVAPRYLLSDRRRQTLLCEALDGQIRRERQRLESGLSLLASIGSVAPFIGLFGTVWGIMDALGAIGQRGAVNLGEIAGPIGHALLTTAVGIASAVPAVLAYNGFLRLARGYEIELRDFALDILRDHYQAAFPENDAHNRNDGLI